MCQSSQQEGYKVLVIEKNPYIGGHCYTEKRHGIDVHVEGPHIFNTSHEDVWEYIQQFGEFNGYVHKALVNYDDTYYSFPINLMTFQQLWNTVDPQVIKEKIAADRKKIEPTNFQEHFLSEVGPEIYYKFFYGYTKKQWQKNPKEIPLSVAKRIPIRYTFDDRYFFSKYQGIPVEGYTLLITNMLEGIKVIKGEDYFSDRDRWDRISREIIYTGPLDKFFDYCYGSLDYLSLKFEHEVLDMQQFQGASQINYTKESVPWTRIIEHKHFNPSETNKTVVTKEYSLGWNGGKPYYPLNDVKNSKLVAAYNRLRDKTERIHIGGRLGCYKYFDMDDSIKEAMLLVERITNA